MKIPLPLLEVLADGECHSGEELGAQLGVSRAAVWKQIKSLRELGLAIDGESGEGYRLEQALDLLNTDRLREQLSGRADFVYAPVMGSSNQYVQQHIERQGLARPLVVTTELQQMGRGRRGRQWQAGFARSVLLSVGVRIPCAAMQLGGLSLACGVAVVNVLKAEAPDIQLKWPNDLLLDGGKLGGLLIEITGESDGPCDVVIGLGLNVTRAPSLEAVGQQASALGGAGRSRTELVAQLAEALLSVAEQFADKGLIHWRDAWQELNAYKGQSVRILQGERVLQGRCAGIDAHGALLLETEEGVQPIYAGDVSLRGDM